MQVVYGGLNAIKLFLKMLLLKQYMLMKIVGMKYQRLIQLGYILIVKDNTKTQILVI